MKYAAKTFDIQIERDKRKQYCKRKSIVRHFIFCKMLGTQRQVLIKGGLYTQDWNPATRILNLTKIKVD